MGLEWVAFEQESTLITGLNKSWTILKGLKNVFCPL